MRTNQFTTSAKKGLASLGPGIITAALVFGPGSLTITSKMGAMFGFSMLWVVALSVFFMMSYTEMGARIGIVSKNTLLTDIRNRWGKTNGSLSWLGYLFNYHFISSREHHWSGFGFLQNCLEHLPCHGFCFLLLWAFHCSFSNHFIKCLRKLCWPWWG